MHKDDLDGYDNDNEEEEEEEEEEEDEEESSQTGSLMSHEQWLAARVRFQSEGGSMFWTKTGAELIAEAKNGWATGIGGFIAGLVLASILMR